MAIKSLILDPKHVHSYLKLIDVLIQSFTEDQETQITIYDTELIEKMFKTVKPEEKDAAGT